MTMDKQHPLQPYWNLLGAGIQADVLTLALEQRLFDVLATAADATQLARHYGWDILRTANLLEMLYSMGLLVRYCDAKQHFQYQPSKVVRDYFCSEAEVDCSIAWDFRYRTLRDCGAGLATALPCGPAPATGQNEQAQRWAQAAERQIAQEQLVATAPAARQILRQQPEFSVAKRLLDLGGGPGWVAIALAQENLQLQVQVFDWPETVRVAAQNIAACGLSERVGVRGGDLLTQDIGAGYDIIWCSSVLHFVDEPIALLRKVRQALCPGGILICAHADIADEPDTATLQTLSCYLPLLMRDKRVERQGVLSQQLQQAGFSRVGVPQLHDFPLCQVQIVVAYA